MSRRSHSVRSGWWIVSIETRPHTSAAPARRSKFWPGAGGFGHSGVLSGVGRSVVPVGDQRKRICGAIGLNVTSLPDHHGRVEARLLRHVAVVSPGSDQGATPFAGDTRAPSHERPAAGEHEIVDESCSAYVAG